MLLFWLVKIFFTKFIYTKKGNRMTTKKSKKLVVSLSKAVLGLSLVTYLHAGDIQDDLTSYIKKYEPELYEKTKGGEIEIDDSISSEHEEDMKTAHKIPRDDIIPISPRKECEQNNGIFLENNYIATCVSENGTFGNGYRLLGMAFNPEGTGSTNATDFLRPGIPWEFFSVKFNDKQYVNNNTGTYQIPTKISPLNRFSSYWIREVSSNLKAKKRERPQRERPFRYTENGGVITYSTIKSDDKNELQIVQKYTVDPNSREIIVRVEMYNPGEVTLKDLYYARGLNPNQDKTSSNIYPYSYYTLNMRGGRFGGLSINSNNIAQGIGINSKLAVALYSVDPIKHNTCISRWGWTTNPQQIALNSSSSCNNMYYPIYSNSSINIGFSLGELKPKEKKVFSFKYLFEKRKVIPFKTKKELKKSK